MHCFNSVSGDNRPYGNLGKELDFACKVQVPKHIFLTISQNKLFHMYDQIYFLYSSTCSCLSQDLLLNLPPLLCSRNLSVSLCNKFLVKIEITYFLALQLRITQPLYHLLESRTQYAKFHLQEAEGKKLEVQGRKDSGINVNAMNAIFSML